jgi:hypothetical protein
MALEEAFPEPDLLDFIIGKSVDEVVQEGEDATAVPVVPGGEAKPDRL